MVFGQLKIFALVCGFSEVMIKPFSFCPMKLIGIHSLGLCGTGMLWQLGKLSLSQNLWILLDLYKSVDFIYSHFCMEQEKDIAGMGGYLENMVFFYKAKVFYKQTVWLFTG